MQNIQNKKENAFKNINLNWIKVITGPMFCGKTTELLKSIKRYKYAGINSICFISSLDTRNINTLKSRDGYEFDAIKISSSKDILTYLENNKDIHYDIIAIDEIQFCDSNIVSVVKTLAKMNHIVICSGLDLDYNANPFGSMPELLSIADEVIKLKAICMVCGGPATKTYLKNNKYRNSNNNILIGDINEYEARCNIHFNYK